MELQYILLPHVTLQCIVFYFLRSFPPPTAKQEKKQKKIKEDDGDGQEDSGGWHERSLPAAAVGAGMVLQHGRHLYLGRRLYPAEAVHAAWRSPLFLLEAL